jgi:hypothetical protein
VWDSINASPVPLQSLEAEGLFTLTGDSGDPSEFASGALFKGLSARYLSESSSDACPLQIGSATTGRALLSSPVVSPTTASGHCQPDCASLLQARKWQRGGNHHGSHDR